MTVGQTELPVPSPEPGDVARRADEIVSRSEFNTEPSGLERFFDWVGRLLTDAIGAASGGGVGTIIALAIAGVGLAFLIRFLIGLSAVSGLARVARTEAVVETSGPAATEHRSGDQWRAEAERLEATQQWDEALRARYRAVLADLIEADAVADVAGRTPGEYRRELAAAAPMLAPAFASMTDRFERVWYGPDDATAADLDAARADEAALATARRDAPALVGADA